MVIFVEEERYKEEWQRKRNTGTGAGCNRTLSIVFFTLAIMFMFIIAPAVATDTAGDTTNPTVVITSYIVSPAVLLPGDQGTITLTITNTAESASVKENTGIVSGGTFANTKSTDINVYIENVHLEENGIEILTDDFDRLGELGPGQSFPVTFVIRAPAKSGIYFPEAWSDVKDGRSTRYPITVNVNTDISTQKKPVLSVSQSLPARVAPGEECAADIVIINTGLTRASDVSVVANSSTKSFVLTTSSRYYSDHLEPGENMTIGLRFATDKNTPIGINPVTLSVSYRNPDGTLQQQTETLGIPVKGRAEIAVSSIATDPVRPTPGSPFTLVVRVENTGTDRATSVRVLLDSPFAGTTNAFIGSIDKDSDAPAIFYLQATRDGAVPANLTITYNDDFGSHSISEQAMVMTVPVSGVTSVVLAILLLCVIVGAAYWYFRIRPGKKNGE
jgi:hypothetical protein